MVRGVAERAIRQELTRTVEGASDEELLAQFLGPHHLASEDAFQALVGRHGPRVLGICRHVLDREHDAEDAFQATFLALARNAASIRERCALAGWLHEVAYRTALKTRARRARRRMVERESMVVDPPRDEPDDQGERAVLAELRPVLHEEVTGLPDKYRIPVVLSYLEGKTNEEVAALLKWPIGTVKGRLSRGRALLRSRLTRRGVALSAGALLWELSQSSAPAAEVPAELLQRALWATVESGSPPELGDSPSSPSPENSGGLSSDEPASPGESAGVDQSSDEAELRPGLPGPEPLLAIADRSPALRPTDAVDPASSPIPDAGSPPLLGENGRGRSRADRLMAVGALFLAFLLSVSVGGFVSATAYGGRFPDLRQTFARFSPWSSKSIKPPCRTTTDDSSPSAAQNRDQTATRSR